MNNRIKELRVHLGMNQTDFGKRLGIKFSTVSGIERGTSPATEQTIKSIVREFGVSEDWLRTGQGEMFAPANDIDPVQELAARYGLSPESAAIIRIYCGMSEAERLALCRLCVEYAVLVDDIHAADSPPAAPSVPKSEAKTC